MNYIKNRLDYTIEEETVITLGKFDGLHRGHELLMENLFAKSMFKSSPRGRILPKKSIWGRISALVFCKIRLFNRELKKA